MEYKVVVRKKTVDSTYMDVQVPSITKPKYAVAEGINLIPVNGLMNVRSPWEKYVVIGKKYRGLFSVGAMGARHPRFF